jgi:hypothetical protein
MRAWQWRHPPAAGPGQGARLPPWGNAAAVDPSAASPVRARCSSGPRSGFPRQQLPSPWRAPATTGPPQTVVTRPGMVKLPRLLLLLFFLSGGHGAAVRQVEKKGHRRAGRVGPVCEEPARQWAVTRGQRNLGFHQSPRLVPCVIGEGDARFDLGYVYLFLGHFLTTITRVIWLARTLDLEGEKNRVLLDVLSLEFLTTWLESNGAT